MKIKLFVPIYCIVRENVIIVDGEETTVRAADVPCSLEPCSDYYDASRALDSLREGMKTTRTDDDGNETQVFSGNIVSITQRIAEQVIDTEDFDEYKPTFEVQLRVRVTKTIAVEITGCDDEYEAEQQAIANCENDEYEDELNCTYTDHIDVDSEGVEEI